MKVVYRGRAREIGETAGVFIVISWGHKHEAAAWGRHSQHGHRCIGYSECWELSVVMTPCCLLYCNLIAKGLYWWSKATVAVWYRDTDPGGTCGYFQNGALRGGMSIRTVKWIVKWRNTEVVGRLLRWWMEKLQGRSLGQVHVSQISDCVSNPKVTLVLSAFESFAGLSMIWQSRDMGI